MHAPELFTLYEELKTAGEQQLAKLDDENPDAFIHASETRESLFAAIQARENELANLPPRTRAYIRDLIQAILAVDEELQAALTEASERTLEELQGLQNGIQALQSYGVDSEAPAYYVDRSG
jgi:hypothetical protein